MTDIIGYSVSELMALKLHPVYANNSMEIVCFIERGDTLWQGELNRYLKQLNDETLVDRKVFRRCASTSKLGAEKCFFKLADFTRTAKGWETSVRQVKNQVTKAIRDEFRTQNMPFLRYYAMGNPEARIVCPITGIQIDGFKWRKFEGNAWVGHHIRFVDGKSVLKENADPGALLSGVDFSKPSARSRFALQDLARNIFLSSTGHDFLHKNIRTGDITDYENDELPWALRCEANWNEFNDFVMSFGHESLGDYQVWFDEQKN